MEIWLSSSLTFRKRLQAFKTFLNSEPVSTLRFYHLDTSKTFIVMMSKYQGETMILPSEMTFLMICLSTSQIKCEIKVVIYLLNVLSVPYCNSTEGRLLLEFKVSLNFASTQYLQIKTFRRRPPTQMNKSDTQFYTKWGWSTKQQVRQIL